MLIRKFFDDGDGAGSDGSGTTTPTKVEYNGPTDSGGNPDYEAFYNDVYLKEHHPKIVEHDSLLTKYDSLKSKVGTQGNELKKLKDLQAAYQNNPREYLRSAAKQAKLDHVLKFTDEDEVELDIADIVNDDSLSQEDKNKRINDFLKKRDEATVQKALKQIEPIKQEMELQKLKAEFPNWDDLAEERAVIMQDMLAKNISLDKVVHLAVQANNIPEVIKDAKKAGYDEAMKEIQDKMGEGIDVSNLVQPKKKDKKEAAYFDNVVKVLSNVR